MKDIDLNEEDLRKVAELIEKTNLEEIIIKPSEAKLLFKLDNDPIDLKDFVWNIRAGFVKGRIGIGFIDGKKAYETVIYPPNIKEAAPIKDPILLILISRKYKSMNSPARSGCRST